MIVLFAMELVLQKDLGTLSILAMTYLACVEIPTFPVLKKTQNRIIVALLVLIVLGVGLFFVTNIGTNIIAQTPFSHVATRIENAKNPYNDIYGEGYQPANSLYAIGSSNVIGKGLGESSRKYGYLTQADNDYILAVVLEETGIIGFGLIILMYVFLLGRLLY
jgi:cell division protein FtsW